MTLSRQFQKILESLPAVQTASCCVVAYSGGVDSHVLLHLCKSAGLPLRAVHIHHGLQTDADAWDMHCRKVCEQLDIGYRCLHVNAVPAQGESPEDAARTARYQALVEQLAADEVLLTAHHLDDQAETFLLQLLRGAGPAGLASMPLIKPFGEGHHVRPLLTINQDQIRQYAEEHQLDWVDDPSNADISYDRNYLRQEVLPLLRKNWPAMAESISQAANLQQDSLEIIDAMAAIDLSAVAGQQKNSLIISRLRELPVPRQYNVLRYWINQAGYDKPKRNILQEILNSVVPAAEDATPLVFWGDTEVRRYKDMLYVLPALSSEEIHHVYAWDGEQPLYVDTLKLELRLEQSQGKGLQQNAVTSGLTVRFRQGGEQIRPHGRRHTHSLKKLMQEAGIPPWQRNRIPLLYINNELACVCGYWVAESYSVSEDQQGWNPICSDMDTSN